jgi:hypothetical protein
MGVHLAVTGINHEPFKIRFIDQLFQQCLPDTVIAPAAKSPMRVFPVTITGRKIAPWRSCTQNPKHRIDELPVVLGNSAPLSALPRQMGPQ